MHSSPPLITLKGNSFMTIVHGQPYDEPGAFAIDEKDGNVSVSITGSVDSTKLGPHKLTYHATDSEGNKATSYRRILVIPLSVSKLTLECNTAIMNVGDTAKLFVQATYINDNTEVVTKDVEWVITPSHAVRIDGDKLKAKDNAAVKIQAKLIGKLSNAITIDINWITDGFKLPPAPDTTINNATLEGIDSNNNGIRDDVERKIFHRYPKRLHRALLMYSAVLFQEALVRPLEMAKETQKIGTKALDCKLYLMDLDDEINSDEFSTVTFLEDATINTKERVRKYLDYNIALSGGVYGSSPKDWNRDACSPDVIKALEAIGK